ncbi:MAG TPA: hypothetical protein VIC51_13445 [Psychromonas sp.]
MPKIRMIENVGEVEFPDEMSDQEIDFAIIRNQAADVQSMVNAPQPTQQPSMTELMQQSGYGNVADFDPYGGSVNKFALGVGKGIVDTSRGIGQRLGMVSESDIAKARELDKPLLESTAAQAGNIAGSILPALPTAFIPGANTYLGSSLIGGGLGFAQPTTSDDSITANTILGTIGGAAGKTVGDLVGSGISKATSVAKTIPERLRSISQTGQIPLAQQKAQQVLQTSGINLNDLSESVRNSILQDTQEALKIQPNLSKDALNRLLDYRITGATPRKAQLTLDPTDVTRQTNLEKLAVNTAGEFKSISNQNNSVLLQNLDELGAANSTGELFDAGNNVLNSASNYLQGRKSAVTNLYDVAQGLGGRDVLYNTPAFTQKVSKNLDSQLKNAFLPTEIKTIVNDVAQGKIPLNIQVAEQLKTILSSASRAAKQSGNGNAVSAIKIVRDALEETPLVGGVGDDVLQAFNAARKEAFNLKKLQENAPILKAIDDGVEPDKIFDKYIVRSNLSEFKNTLDVLDDQAKQQLKNDIVAYIKSKSTAGNLDNTTAKISSSAIDKAFGKNGLITNKKLELLFNKDEIARLNAIKNVIKYETTQPVGSAVNNSNTASALYSALDRVAKRLPFGQSMIADPLSEITTGVGVKRALNVPRSILDTTPLPPSQSNFRGLGGILGAESFQERN